uniref:Uncharacterized protein n=1 Tax=Compsopogon caeruleus TaxID=31354 RepID=A0A7S1XG21_9RHOD|mmetsp:Transcript_8092/g.16281  ORF Transcript_8092/g.16281 Transcript_8092/m.16281 type:complete len:120 (+) Transcript_8092:85-444(+)
MIRRIRHQLDMYGECAWSEEVSVDKDSGSGEVQLALVRDRISTALSVVLRGPSSRNTEGGESSSSTGGVKRSRGETDRKLDGDENEDEYRDNDEGDNHTGQGESDGDRGLDNGRDGTQQ